MGLVRGDLTIMVLSGDYGKPRPVIVVQSDLFQASESVVVVPLTTVLRPNPTLFRIRLEPTDKNGIRTTSEVMVDKVTSVLRTRGGAKIGRLELDAMTELSAALAIFLGF